MTYIHIDGEPVVPSFRAERGSVTTSFDPEFVLVKLMHPYDIVQKLGEAGNFKQAFAALEGFLKREVDIWAEAAYARLEERRDENEAS